MKNSLCILLFMLSVFTLQAQHKLTGQINSDDKPAENVSVRIAATKFGAKTDSKGFFNIANIPNGNYTVIITLLGHEKKEVKVQINGDTTLPTVSLRKKNEALQEVVINKDPNKFTTATPSNSLRLKTEISKLPQNIQIVTKEVIESQNIINMMENVTRNVSGAQMIEHWGQFARINMRGFKLPAFRNGMNVEMPWGPLSEDMSMVERIEFVKGPSGFMMSAGEPGGFYNVVTKKPTKNRVNEITLNAGSFNSYRGAFDSGGPLSQDGKFQYRVNGMFQTQESHRDFEESNRYSFVPSFKYEFSDNTSITTEFTYQRAKQMIGAAYVFAPASAGFGSLPRDFSAIDKGFPKTTFEELSLLTNFTHKFNEKWSLEAQYMIMRYNQIGASTWPASIAPNGDMVRNVSIWDAYSTNELGQIYINGEFKTGPLTHKTMGGFDFRNLGYYADWGQAANVDLTPFNVFNPVYGNAVYPVFDRSKSIKERGAANYQGIQYSSFYAQDEIWTFNDKLRITLASRYVQGKTFAYGQTAKESRFTPRFGLSYDITPSLTLYGLYDQAFTPQAGASRTGASFDPILATDIEGGLKKSWFNNRLKTGISVYQITKKNVLVTDPENINFSVQLGEVQSKGIEFDMQGQITPELNIILNYANSDVEITKDTNPANIGTKVAGFSKHSTNGWVNYNFKQDSPLKGFGISLGYQYLIDRSTWDWGADNQSNLPDYFRLDGGLSWKNKHIHVNLNVNNILNRYLYSGASYGSYIYWQSEPGTNGRLTVTYKF